MVVGKSEKNSSFDKINELYSQYLDLKKKTDSNDTNNKFFVAFKIIKEKLIIEIYNRYVNLDEKIIDKKGHDIPKNIYANEDNYSDIIVEEILYSLETYETFVNDKEKYAFSNYVCMRINNSKGKAHSKKISSDNQGGSSITEYEASMIRKIKKAENDFKKIGYEENLISKKIALLFNISENMVHKYQKMGQSNVVSTEITTKEGKKYSVFEMDETFLKENQNMTEKELFIKQRTEQVHLILSWLEEFYKKKSDKKISEILTVTVLKEFESERQVFIEDQNLETFYSYWVNDLIKYNFMDNNILISFFQDPEYILPTQKMIENKYGLKEKYAGKILQRIREALLKTDIVKEFRNTWIEN